MSCQHHIIQGPICGKPIKRFNACGIHKKLANDLGANDDPQERSLFEQFTSQYTSIMQRCKEATNCLEAKGGNILAVQRAYGWNLTNKPNFNLLIDPDEMAFIEALLDGQALIQQYVCPYLIFNASTKINQNMLA